MRERDTGYGTGYENAMRERDTGRDEETGQGNEIHDRDTKMEIRERET